MSLLTPRGIYTGCCCLHQVVTANAKRNIYPQLLSSPGGHYKRQEEHLHVVAVFIRWPLQTPRGTSTRCCCLHQVATTNAKRNIYALLLSSSGGHYKRQEEHLRVVTVVIRWSLQTPRGISTGCHCHYLVVTANTKWNIYRLFLWSSGGHSKRQEEYQVVIVVIFILLSSSGGHCKRQEEYQVVTVLSLRTPTLISVRIPRQNDKTEPNPLQTGSKHTEG